MSRSSQIAANTFSKDPDASEISVESNTNSSSQSGTSSFDISTFDPTSPASWEALGKMWETMNGYTPSAEELMQFMMMGAMSQSVLSKNWQQQSSMESDGTSGCGGGYGRENYGNSRNNHHGQNFGGEDTKDTNWRSTDAVVLGGDSADPNIDRAEGRSENQQSAGSENRGGKMQKVGDKWVFIRSESTTS
jgi:protein NRD1